jgi:hypothetical protein
MAHMRGFFGFLATLIVVGLLVSLGAGIYQAGVAQGVIDAGRFPAGATVPVNGYGWHGPDFFGILIGLFFLFILFGIIRAAFFGGRGGWGHHGDRHGYGWGPGWDKGDGPGGHGSWRSDRDSRIAEWHRRLHDEEGGSTAPGGSPASGGTAGGLSGGGPAGPLGGSPSRSSAG